MKGHRVYLWFPEQYRAHKIEERILDMSRNSRSTTFPGQFSNGHERPSPCSGSELSASQNQRPHGCQVIAVFAHGQKGDLAGRSAERRPYSLSSCDSARNFNRTLLEPTYQPLTRSTIPPPVAPGNNPFIKLLILSPSRGITLYRTPSEIECDSQIWTRRRSSSNHCPINPSSSTICMTPAPYMTMVA